MSDKTRNIGIVGKTIINELQSILDCSTMIDTTTNQEVDIFLKDLRRSKADSLAEGLMLIAELDSGFKDAFINAGFLEKE